MVQTTVRTAEELPAAFAAAEARLLAGDADDALAQIRHAQEVFWGPEPAARIRARLSAYRVFQRAGVEPIAAQLLALGVDELRGDAEGWDRRFASLVGAGLTSFDPGSIGSLTILQDVGRCVVSAGEDRPFDAPLLDPGHVELLRRTLGAEGAQSVCDALAGDADAAHAAVRRIGKAAEEHHVRRAPETTLPPPPEPGLLDTAINPWVLALIGFACLGFFFYELAHANGFLGFPGIIAFVSGFVFLFAGVAAEGGEVRPSIAILGVFFGGLS